MPRKCLIDDSVCGLWRTNKPEDYSVCFPSPIAIGASGDPEVAREMASLVAQSAAEEGIPLLLTPAVNRVSTVQSNDRGLCFSDDLDLNLQMLTAWIQGLQDNGVGAVLRLLPNDNLNEKQAFHHITETVKVCAMTTADGNITDVEEAIEKAKAFQKRPKEFDWGMQHHQARKLARNGIVLLKNDDHILPIHGNPKIAMIGAAAKASCFRSSGLPSIVCTETLSALQAVRSVSPIQFAVGYHPDYDEPDEMMESEAVNLAAESDLVLLFLQADIQDDRFIVSLPNNQEKLLKTVTEVQPKIVVILHTDRPVEMPWIKRVSGFVVAFPGGQAGGAAVIDLIFGAIPFRAKLPVAVPCPGYGTGFGLTV